MIYAQEENINGYLCYWLKFVPKECIYLQIIILTRDLKIFIIVSSLYISAKKKKIKQK